MKKIISILLCIAMVMTFMPIAFAEEATGVAINEENFPDENFRNYISEFKDWNKDGTLSADEIEAVETIITYDSFYYEMENIDIKDFEGIAYFKNLKTFWCGSSSLTSLDVSENKALENLRVAHSPISELDISNCTKLISLACCMNWNITSLDISKNTALVNLEVNNTQISELDVSNCSNLSSLDCSYTNITSLDVSNNKSLYSLSCSGTNIEKINLKSNHKIKYLYADKSTVVMSPETFLRYKFEQNTPEKLKNYIYFDVKEAEFSENKTIDKFCHFAADALIIVIHTPYFVFNIIHDGNNG